ncbi:Mrp/NBP35 family ATP-binding protein [Nostoc ellipsosporum NOK]|jgi:ATP-binding protein involved in chromosome partitioning|nr:Mrp/NBP35 family ATP-binding protein [Nostoc ellipsosporum NOK]
MADITQDQILDALRNVQDPTEGKDIVSLNKVGDIVVEKYYISFTLDYPAGAGSVRDEVKMACISTLRRLIDKNVVVRVNFTGKAAAAKPLQDAPPRVLGGVRNTIAVFSGKGGVGKSTVAANLALALAETGATVGLMDADIYGPSVPIMFGVRGERPMMKDVNGKGMIVPLEKYGIRLMSIGLLVDEKNAVVWRGPMASSAIRQFITDVEWGDLDYLVIDMPPGTGDIHLTLLQTVPVSGAVIVSTPQDVALADAKKGIAMFGQAQLNVKVLGLVENMSYFTPAELPDNKYYIFGKEGGKRLADEYDLPFLGQIPLVQGIREGGDRGKPIMISEDEITKEAFRAFAGEVTKQLI